jgi:aldose 1-epimerase
VARIDTHDPSRQRKRRRPRTRRGARQRRAGHAAERECRHDAGTCAARHHDTDPPTARGEETLSAPAPSGEQFQIVHGEQRATIVEVGGGIREYEVAGRPVLDSYPLDAICDGGHGTPLIPWPNRLKDGLYSFDGADYRVALTEPAKQNAIHGFLRWWPWRAIERGPDRVVMGVPLHPHPGYPFTLDIRVQYALGDDGLTVTTTATNLGEQACPYGMGQHPYLSPGHGTIDACTLELPADTRILVDDQRSLPVGSEPVEGSAFDFRHARPLGELSLDTPFTDLRRDSSGLARSRLTAPDGTCVELWMDERYGFLEVFTGDGLAPSRRRRGLAVEPMTCAPNAFQSGDGLVRLEPGESISGRWGARLVGRG